MDKFRNMGGFDMIRSGRHKIETLEQKKQSLKVCRKLDLHGLVVIGGDDSNTNAAILAEYFESEGCSTRVIGCPKTIDGDLRAQLVEASFGFDTACKTYSEFIGNLCMDVATSGKYYHFVRLMGRSASHIALECAMQTRPNLTLIGEEVQAKRTSLKQIVDEIVDLVVARHANGRDFGVILVPEGLIEFIPEMGELISEINQIVAGGAFEVSRLSPGSRQVFDSLPSSIRDQLLLDRDPHGNVQVAMIATERLLILMVQKELERKKHPGLFNPEPHYFGYEGRCGMPSNFDANYCCALGHAAAALVDEGLTGYMAVVRHLHRPPAQWEPAGVPLTQLMQFETRKGKLTPVIRKYVVDLQGPAFKLFTQVREEWKTRDLYCCPGPIQLEGPLANRANFTITPPTLADLLPDKPANFETLKARQHFVMSLNQMSALQRERLASPVLASVCPQLTDSSSGFVASSSRASLGGQETQKAILMNFPLLCARSQNTMYDVAQSLPASPKMTVSGCSRSAKAEPILTGFGGASLLGRPGDAKPLKVGIVITGQQAPGVSNILWGLAERIINMGGGKVLGFSGATGLLNKEFIEIEQGDLEFCRNQGGFCLLGRTSDTEGTIAYPTQLARVKETCQQLDLDGLVMIGGRWTLTDSAVLAEYFLKHNLKTNVIGVPATQNNNLDPAYIECTTGFDTASKCYSQLIGNLLTDAASATKYWYFVRLMGRDKSHVVLETALQGHPNVVLISERYADGDKTLDDVVQDIADVVAARAEEQKNFGTVLIPEGLVAELPQMRQLLNELSNIMAHVAAADLPAAEKELVHMDVSSDKYTSRLSESSMDLLRVMPTFIRKQVIQIRHQGRFQLSKVATEELLSKLVSEEIAKRRSLGQFPSGSFSPVCFYFGYQARSSLPSMFDCSLGLSLGLLAGMCIEANLTGYVPSMRGLCGPSHQWRPRPIPVSALLKLHGHSDVYAAKVPMVPSAMARLDGRAVQKVERASEMWRMEDRFCNPGPLQFYGPPMHFYTRYLFEQHHQYLEMLEELDSHISFLRKINSFGIDELLLKSTCAALQMVRKIAIAHGDVQAVVEQRRGSGPTKEIMGSPLDDYTLHMTGANVVGSASPSGFSGVTMQ
eukprot:GHVT01004990.1.p1 GENE.GHVT01004990.1~~GHVT01004990.1.p1  ORF type:complete len:1120 (-),score=212.44 GHVT01004990.1:658-4017(-)